ELDPYVPIASVGKVIVGLRWNDPAILDHLMKVIREQQIHIVLPFVDPATVIASTLKKRIGNDVFIPVPDEEVCRTMFDKSLAHEWFLANDFTVPAVDDQLPLIAKPKKGSASSGLVVMRTENERKCFLQNYNAADYLIQRWINADEYTVDCYVGKKGEILSVIPRKRLEVTSGESTKSITDRDEEMIVVSKKILSTKGFSGPVTIQFLKEKETGKRYVMEINPRFGGGVLTSIHAGANIPLMILNDLQGLQNSAVEKWTEQLVMTRTFREFYYHATNH
ncbi:MAG TPA: ATP-grasp domain-containing protein, partial [Bacteroidia bacterium]|nr:ATP-grasp domain-containing protein [Bacteroidia bacterium]